MHAPWETMRRTLVRCTTAPESRRAFCEVTALLRAIGRFRLARLDDPAAARAFLARGDARATDRAELLAALVIVARDEEGRGGDVAAALLWLALWPRLDAIVRRLRRRARVDPAELTAEVAAALTAQIAAVDLGRLAAVEATLVAGTARALRRWRRRHLRGWGAIDLVAEPEARAP